MNKDEILAKTAKKLKALDNKTKLKILSLLVEEGAKSITDISKELNINFSTAHKYLERLEKAKLVTSKQVTDSRLKRLFYVNDFNIDVSPAGISELLGDVKTKTNKKSFKIFNVCGDIVDFDERLFAKKYLKRGLPRALIDSGISAIKERAFDGITLAGLHANFRKHLLGKVHNITNVLREVDRAESKSRTFENILTLTHPEALQQHKDGDIFIKNLGKPKLLNFVHDIYGLSAHGVGGKKPKTLKQLFDAFFKATKIFDKASYDIYLLDSFNYFIAPFTKDITSSELEKTLKNFLIKLDKLNYKIFISLEIGLPKYLEEVAGYYRWKTKKSKLFKNYKKLSEKINLKILKIIRRNKLENINIMLRFWKNLDASIIENSNNIFIINMKPKWQTLKSNYVGNFTRFDANWKGWPRTVRIGEIQNIVINLPRIAIKSESEKEFFINLKKTTNSCVEYTFNMAELAIGEFLRKHNVDIESPLRGRWKYLHADDCAYSISLVGLNETVKMLSNKNLSKNQKLGKNILKVCNQVIKKNEPMPFRIQLKEELNQFIANRFHELDSEEFKLKNIKAYSPGIQTKDIKISAKLQKYLPGGHCVETDKKNIKKLFQTNFGLIKIK